MRGSSPHGRLQGKEGVLTEAWRGPQILGLHGAISPGPLETPSPHLRPISPPFPPPDLGRRWCSRVCRGWSGVVPEGSEKDTAPPTHGAEPGAHGSMEPWGGRRVGPGLCPREGLQQEGAPSQQWDPRCPWELILTSHFKKLKYYSNQNGKSIGFGPRLHQFPAVILGGFLLNSPPQFLHL